MWSILGMFMVALGVVTLTRWMYKWRNPKCSGVLPPGSMGLPFVGETFQFFTTSKSVDLSPFIKTRINKYGRVFKTNLMCQPVVVSSDPEFNHYILQQEGKLVELWYMDSLSKLLGISDSKRPGSTPTNSIGHIHKFARNLILSQIGIENIRETILLKMEDASRETLHAWASTPGSIELKRATATMVFNLSANLLFGYDPKKSKENNISEGLGPMLQGLMSFPLNVPGTTFHKCLQNQKAVIRVLKDLMDERLAFPEKRRGDLLDLFLDGMKTESLLRKDFILYLMFAILLASFEGISGIICFTIMSLSDHPQAVKELEKEQEGILRNRKDKESMLSWKEYKSMTFTKHVVNESLRMANVSPGLFRRATEDIHVHGYTIPKGWTIMVAGSALQMNPEMYDDPLLFNPWRWKDLGPSVLAKTFMPFGWGMRTCVGTEFSKAFMAVFLHVLISNYKWEKVKGGDVTRSPLLSFGDGIHIKVFKKYIYGDDQQNVDMHA